jgi:beta-phosphoglucomutase-like phosphatase (HAD superfamily)
MEDKEDLFEKVIRLADKEIPSLLFKQHIPLAVLENVKNGLMTLPLAPEYEIHREHCRSCAENYAFVADFIGDFSRFSNSIVADDDWEETDLMEGAYKGELLSAMKTRQTIYAVAGELNCSVYDEEICAAIEAFAAIGGEFNIIAGPMVEKLDTTESSPFIDRVEKRVKNINYYVSDRRQNLHFALGDKTGLIHLEAFHAPMTTRRRRARKSSVDWATLIYLKSRYEIAFSSPDVRPYAGRQDIVLDYRRNIETISNNMDDNGLSRFGKYGYLVEREIERKRGEEVFEKLKEMRVFLLDFDGTIADTEKLHFQSYKTMLEKQERTLDFELFKKLVGKTRDDAYGILKKDLKIEFDNVAFEYGKNAVFHELQEDEEVQVYPIIKDILFSYFPDKPAYIVSSQNAGLINRLLMTWDLRDRFSGIHTTDGASSKEGTIREMIEAQSCPPRSVAFFDDVKENLTVGRKMGLYCVGIRNAYNKETLGPTDADILIPV